MCAGGVQVTQLTTRVSDLEQQVEQGEAQATALRAQHTVETARLLERVAELNNLAMMKEEDVSEAIYST